MEHILIGDIKFSWDAILTALSVVGAMVAFVFRSWQSQKQERRTNTFQLLSRLFEQGPVAEARIVMARWVAQGRIFENDDVTPEEERVVLVLIDFYEFMCEGALRRVVDAKLLDQEAGGRMERAYFVVRGYERARQERLTRLNRERGLGPVVLHRHLRKFLQEQRGVKIAD
jgi:hypothetical protein